MTFEDKINDLEMTTYLVLPMLGKHPNEYPRYRDCFTHDVENPEYEDHIHIYTRTGTGGGNRKEYETENQAMRGMEGFVTDFDDFYDTTFASWVFEIPERWKADYQLIKDEKYKQVSIEYQNEIKRIFPELEEEIDNFFS